MKKTRNRILISALILSLLLFVFALAFYGMIPMPNMETAKKIQKTVVSKIKRPARLDNESYKTLLEKGFASLGSGDLDKARAYYQKASEIEPREWIPYEKIGDINLLEKNYVSALQNFQFAHSLNATSDQLDIKAVKSMLGLRKIFDAKAALDAIAVPTQASLYYQGLIFAFLNEQENAKNFLTKSMSMGEDESLKTNAQKMLTAYRDFELSREAPIEFLQTMIAKTFDAIGEYGLAIELGFDAIKTKPDYRDAWIILGHAFLNENKLADAHSAFSKAIDLDSSSGAAFFFRGIANRLQQKIPEAKSDFESALKYGWQPKILAKNELADIFFNVKDFESAFPMYKDVVLTDPSDIDRFIRPIALAINHLNLPQDAIVMAKKAYESHPGNAMASNLLGWAYLANGDLKNADQYLTEAVNLDPELDAAYLNRGQLEERRSNFELALNYYQKALELGEKEKNESIKDTAERYYDDLNKKIAEKADAPIVKQVAEPVQILPVQKQIPAPVEKIAPPSPTPKTPAKSKKIPSLNLL